jgi:hypothetical protein
VTRESVQPGVMAEFGKSPAIEVLARMVIMTTEKNIVINLFIFNFLLF